MKQLQDPFELLLWIISTCSGCEITRQIVELEAPEYVGE
jgi:hypothetical protein